MWVVWAGMQSICMSLLLANSITWIEACDECSSRITWWRNWFHKTNGGTWRMMNNSAFTHPVSLQWKAVPATAPASSSSVILSWINHKRGQSKPRCWNTCKAGVGFSFFTIGNSLNISTSNVLYLLSSFVDNSHPHFIHVADLHRLLQQIILRTQSP